MSTATAPTTFQLLAADRCDRCSAQAVVEALSPESGCSLLFCVHHGRIQEPALRATGWAIRWDAERLAELDVKYAEMAQSV